MVTATLRTVPAPGPPAKVIAFPDAFADAFAGKTQVISPSEPTRRVTPVEDLDATWLARPMRLDPISSRKAPAREAGRCRAVPEPWRLDRGGTGAALTLAAGGLWWTLRPAPVRSPASPPPVVSATIAPARAPGSGPPPVSTPVETAKTGPVPRAAEKKPAASRDPLPEEPAPSAAPAEPMKPGDLLHAGQKGVQPPEIQSLPPNPYPPAAKGSGKKVTIRVAVLVDETGQVIDARVREGDKSGLGFEEAALETARKARFFPPTRDAVPGKMWTDLDFVFEE